MDPTECGRRVVESLIKAGAFDGNGANRPQMLAVFDTMMGATQASRRRNVEGQVSLFDMLGESGEQLLKEPEIAFPPLPDFPLQTKLQMEKEASGLYLSGHPLDNYQDKMKQLACTAASLEADADHPEAAAAMDGLSVVMGGILTEVKGKATKKGDYMAFVTLEDLTGQVECLVFPRVFERYQALLQEDQAVVITGRVSVREEEAPKLLAEKIEKLADWVPAKEKDDGAFGSYPASWDEEVPGQREAERKAQERREREKLEKEAKTAKEKLFLRLNRVDMDRVTAVLALEPGPVPVYFHLPQEQLTLLAPRDAWTVGAETQLGRLNSLLGAENVVLKKHEAK